jgi:hypothetical protein
MEITDKPSRVQEWILFFLLQREKLGLETIGADLLFPNDHEFQELLDRGLVEIEQLHGVPSLQRHISASTIVRITRKGSEYFVR